MARRPLKRTIQAPNGDKFRFEWHGGEYLDVYRVGEKYPFEVANLTPKGGGPLPEFTVEEFTAEIDRMKAALVEENGAERGWLEELSWRAQQAYDV